MNTRSLSPYERTQLARHGLSDRQVKGSVPIEYLTGVADFCGLEFNVNPSVLIPRVETEGLVELALECISEKVASSDEISILDVGTGSGAIIISLAKHLEQTPIKHRLFASDISDEALKTAQENAKKLTTVPIEFKKSDLLKNFPGRIDLITANLPYIPSEAVKLLDDSVLNHEPVLALDGGTDGFSVIRSLLNSVTPKLKQNGALILEVDPSHTSSFFNEYQKNFSISYYNDCFDRHRFVRLDLKN